MRQKIATSGLPVIGRLLRIVAEPPPPPFRMRDPDDPWTELLTEARNGSALRSSPLHGEAHWRAVAAIGFRLAEIRDGQAADREFILAFAMLHDCRREDEAWDPEHGLRAAKMMKGSRAAARIFGPAKMEHLVFAVMTHDIGLPDFENPDIGASWDADRYALVRLDIRPDQRYLSSRLPEKAHLEMIATARRICAEPPSWEDLFWRI